MQSCSLEMSRMLSISLSGLHFCHHFCDHCLMLHVNFFHQCLAARIMTLQLMLLRHLLTSVPRDTCPGKFNKNCFNGVENVEVKSIDTQLLRLTILLLSCRETETFESVAEDDQLPQVVEELHDVHVSPGAPFAKMHLKVKGKFINRDDQ